MADVSCITTVDWRATGTMMQGVGAILAAILGPCAVFGAAWLASNAWRKQKIAERRRDMAERILEASHNGRRALALVRACLMDGNELSVAEKELKDDEYWQQQLEGKQKRLITAQAYFNRLRSTTSEQSTLWECVPLARAVFGPELEEAVEKLRHQFRVVKLYVDAYIDDEKGEDEDFTKMIREAMLDARYPAGAPNEVSDAIEQSWETIESICGLAMKMKERA